MTEHLPINQEQPSPQENILFQSYGEQEEAEPILEAMKAAPATYVIAPDGSAIELSGSLTMRYSDIDRYSQDEEGLYLYLKAIEKTE